MKSPKMKAWNRIWLSYENFVKSKLIVSRFTERPIVGRVEYGVENNENTKGSLQQLTFRLNNELALFRLKLEPRWAFTRYNVIAHSQGGVLMTRLCDGNEKNKNGRYSFTRKSEHRRGRFYNIVTIGSPHNASRLGFYIMEWQRLGNSLKSILLPRFRTALLVSPWIKELIQPKFNPFGSEFREHLQLTELIHDETRFHLIGSRLDLTRSSTKLLLKTLSLENSSKRDAVIPEGSDGVVDFKSQLASMSPGSNISEISTVDVAHFPGIPGISEYQTTSPTVAKRIAEIIDISGKFTIYFSKFISPDPLDPKIATQIRDALPTSIANIVSRPLVFAFFANTAKTKEASGNLQTQVNAHIQLLPEDNIIGEVQWFALNYGPEGIKTDGISTKIDAENSTSVEVVISDNLFGDVVLFAQTEASNNSLIITKPLIVYSKPFAELMGIQGDNSASHLNLGEQRYIELHGIYDDGTVAPLFITDEQDLKVTSSDETVLVIADGPSLKTLASGDVDVTLSYQGFTDTLSVKVFSEPTISILRPVDNSTVTSDSVNFSIDAQQDNGTIDLIDVYDGPDLVWSIEPGEISSNPYEFVIDNLVNGEHIFTANVTNNNGWMGFSDPVKITVLPNTKPIITVTPNIYYLIIGGKAPNEIEKLNGVNARDAEDGDISHHVSAVGEIDMSSIGDSTVFYNVSDSENLAADQRTRIYRVSTDNDADMMPDAWEIEIFGSLNKTADSDFDRDGLSNITEYLRGSDPRSYAINLKHGWNLLSISGVPMDNTVNSIFSGVDISPAIWMWDNKKFVTANNIDPWHGYWVYIRSEETKITITVDNR